MLDIKVSAALMGFTQSEQRKILDAVYGGDTVSTERLSEAVKVVTQIIEDHEEVVEGYAGFPIEKELIQKNKERFKDDRNIGRVISQGGQSMVITGLKSDGRYQVVGKKGEKTAKAPEDIGLNMQREHIDIDDLHQQMVEGLKQARKNVGASTCWDGYKAKGTKKKNGKEVPNCVKEEEIQEKKDCVKAEKKTMHNCAKKVCSEQWGVGECVFGQHAVPDAEGFVAWYDVLFEHGIEKGVDVSTLEVLEEGSHGEHVEHEGQKLDELYKGKHGQSEKEYQDGRSDGGKMISGDSKHSGAAYSSRAVKNTGPNPAGGSKKPKAQGRMTSGARAELAYRKANLKKEEVEQETIEEKKKGLWANIHAKRKRGERPAKPGEKDYPKTLNIEDILHDWDDEELDTISFEELEAICVEALEELDADVLTEALDIIDGMELLSEDYYDSAVKASKEASKTPAAKAGRANLRKEKMKAALKSAGSAVKKGLKTAGKAAAKGAGYAAGATVRAAKAGASEFKKGYDRGREGSTTKSKSSTAVSGDTTRSSSSSSGGSGESRVRLRDRIKSGIKKVVGGAARAVSRGSRNLARRMSEERYSWRKEMGMDE